MYKFLSDLVGVLGGQIARQRSITFILEIRLPTRPERLGLQAMFEPLYHLPITTEVLVESRRPELWSSEWLAWLGGRAAGLGARFDDRIKRQAQHVGAILERDVMPRLAGR